MLHLQILPSSLLRYPTLSLLQRTWTGLRPFSSSPARSSEEDPYRVYISTSTDPWFNLAFEDWLYRKSPPSIPMLFMYRNRDCVVLGRNQNPWKEVNLPLLEANGVPFVRRRSGGGTVFHDLGNTNYSILIPKDMFERRPNAELVARALNTLGVDAKVNDRNDITLDGFKISGSAYKLNNRRAYHHGTMLISAQLAQLGSSLRSLREFATNKGTASVPSPVQNISTHHPHVNHESFVAAVVEEFTRVYGDGGKGSREVEEGKLWEEKEEVEREAAELKSWDWAYGQTPEFSVELKEEFSFGKINATITSKHGLITAASLSPSPSTSSSSSSCPLVAGLEELEASLVGQRFGSSSIGSEQGYLGEELEEVLRWLKEKM
ncbi:hypothetical protein BDY24DRAFT_71388 [Mrakia frigida]|uniref:putative lipoate--protein ligase n=1 Tax=Mrakia frigida TaxID=29902 RepID=UPI003FCC15C7